MKFLESLFKKENLVTRVVPVSIESNKLLKMARVRLNIMTGFISKDCNVGDRAANCQFYASHKH